jgi:energy-coupling factor transport system ATP-binding protein
MIHISNLTFRYPASETDVFKNINLDIEKGEFVLFCGASGIGKSTLLRCMNGLVPHFSGGEIQGDIQVAGLNPITASPKMMSRQVGFVFQDPETQFVLDRVEDDIAFSLENTGIPPDEIRDRVDQILAILELSHLRNRTIISLSGGERQRVAIAASLVFSPSILILDEPTSQLDPQSAEEVLQAVIQIKDSLQLTVLLSEHRLDRTLPYADRIVYFKGGSGEVISGSVQEILPQMAFSPPVVRLGKQLDWSPLPLSVNEAQSFISQFHSEHKTIIPSNGEKNNLKPLLKGEHINGGYNGKLILDDISLEIKAGEILVLMGLNGSGKTTLLRTLVGFQKPKSGQVWLDGHEITAGEPADICRLVGYLPQDPNSLLFAEHVQDELTITLQNHGMRNTNGWTDELMRQLDIYELRGCYPRDLSVGQRQRIALGAILVTRPKVLLLDEPTRGLDPDSKTALEKMLKEWRAEGKAILLVTHDVEMAANLADRVILLQDGRVVCEGNPAYVFNQSNQFTPQMVQLFPDTGWLTVQQTLEGLEKVIL